MTTERHRYLLPSFGAWSLGKRSVSILGRPRSSVGKGRRRTPPRLLLLLDLGEAGLVKLLQLFKAIPAEEQTLETHKGGTFISSHRRCLLQLHLERHHRRGLRPRRPAAPHYRAQIPVVISHPQRQQPHGSDTLPRDSELELRLLSPCSPRGKRDGGVDQRKEEVGKGARRETIQRR